MAYKHLTALPPQFVDGDGRPLSGGTLTAYLAGSATPATMYTNSTGTAAGPVVTLNARGEPEVSGNTVTIWVSDSISYKFQLKTAAGSSIWTVDNINVSTLPATTVTGGEAIVVENYAALKAISSEVDRTTCNMLGFYTAGDGGGGDWYWDDASVEADNLGTIVLPTGHVGAGRWKRICKDVLNVLWFGATNDGLNDVTGAFQAAFDLADDLGGGVVYLPAGTYLKDDAANGMWVMYSNTTLRGDGDCSIINFDDKSSVLRDSNDLLTCSDTTDICFENFKIVGTALTELTEVNQKQCLTGRNIDRLRMQNVTIIGTRYMATAFRTVNNGIFTGNVLEYIARDGIRAVNSWNIVITGNTLKYVADDAIAVHSIDEETVPGSGVIISNNTLEGCQGIKVLGAKICTVSNNVFRRTLRIPIYIELPGTGTEGNSPQFAIDVSHNIITDTFRDRGNTQNIFITQGIGRFDDGLSTMPSVTSDYTPYTYLQGLDGTTMPTIGQFGIIISHNIISTTLGATAAYSDYGYGELFDRITTGFFSDPAVTAATFGGTGIQFNAPVMGLDISHNNISGSGSGNVGIYLRSVDSTNIQDYGNTRVHGNTIYNCPGIGILIPDTGSGVAAKDIHITDNILDLDPFFLNSTHASDNTWTSTGFCLGLSLDGAEGLHISGNIFKNMATTGLSITAALTNFPNILYSDYIAAGDDAGNKGIRTLPINAAGNVIIKIDGDPTSPTYSQTVTVPFPYSNDVPATGYYFRGTFINKINPGLAGTPGSQYLLSGWFRVTTGNAHVLNTDWIESRIPTGT